MELEISMLCDWFCLFSSVSTLRVDLFLLHSRCGANIRNKSWRISGVDIHGARICIDMRNSLRSSSCLAADPALSKQRRCPTRQRCPPAARRPGLQREARPCSPLQRHHWPPAGISYGAAPAAQYVSARLTPGLAVVGGVEPPPSGKLLGTYSLVHGKKYI